MLSNLELVFLDCLVVLEELTNNYDTNIFTVTHRCFDWKILFCYRRPTHHKVTWEAPKITCHSTSHLIRERFTYATRYGKEHYKFRIQLLSASKVTFMLDTNYTEALPSVFSWALPWVIRRPLRADPGPPHPERCWRHHRARKRQGEVPRRGLRAQRAGKENNWTVS